MPAIRRKAAAQAGCVHQAAVWRGSPDNVVLYQITVPYTPVTARRARAWIRRDIKNLRSSHGNVPCRFDRINRRGVPTLERPWLAWL